jgi:hypothetical protein
MSNGESAPREQGTHRATREIEGLPWFRVDIGFRRPRGFISEPTRWLFLDRMIKSTIFILKLENKSGATLVPGMDEGKFDAKALRESAIPPLTRAEVAKRMAVSWDYMDDLEKGYAKWTPYRKQQFLAVLSDWQADPTPVPRKKRSDAGLTHRMRKRRKKKLAMMQGTPIPVPHSHGEVVGVG